MKGAVSMSKKLLPDKIADEIKNMIVDKKLNIGDKLPNELELCKGLDVSRTTVREAIKILVAGNVLEIRRGKGTFVSERLGVSKDPLGLLFESDKKKLIRDLFETRLIIEPELVSLVCERAEEYEIEKMKVLAKEIEELILKKENHLQKDIEFHKLIAKASHNSVVTKIIPIINDSINYGYDATKDDDRVNKDVIRVHRRMVEAISKRDKVMAKDATIEHINIAIDKLRLNLIEK